MLEPGETEQAIAKKWLEENRPDCVIVCEDEHLGFFRGAGDSLPDGLSVVSVDIKGLDRHLSGYLSAAGNVGRTTVDVMADLLNRNERGVPETPRRILIECEWNSGKTLTVRPPGKDA
jgi:DNA-binding LacI/PurR family transcriptional regulator